jgi:hypothetical protein
MPLLGFLHDYHVPAFLLSIFRLSAWLMILAVIFLPLERFFEMNSRVVRPLAP